MRQNKLSRPPQTSVDLSVVVPCYNEGPRVQGGLMDIHKILKSAEHIHSFQIIAVNDGSPDDTLSQLNDLKKDMKELKVVSYQKNQGKGYAVTQGIKRAKGEYVAYIDGDGEIPADYLVKYYHFAKYGEFDVVVGSKTHPLSNSKFSLLRKVMSTGYRVINQALFRLHVKDTQVGIKLFSKKVAKKVFPHIKTNGYAFDIEFLSLANHLGYTLFEAPIEIKHQDQSSSVSVRNIIQAFLDTLRIRGRVSQTIKALELPLATQQEYVSLDQREKDDLIELNPMEVENFLDKPLAVEANEEASI